MCTIRKLANSNRRFRILSAHTPNLSRASLETKNNFRRVLLIFNKKKKMPLLTNTKEFKKKIIVLRNSLGIIWTKISKE